MRMEDEHYRGLHDKIRSEYKRITEKEERDKAESQRQWEILEEKLDKRKMAEPGHLHLGNMSFSYKFLIGQVLAMGLGIYSGSQSYNWALTEGGSGIGAVILSVEGGVIGYLLGVLGASIFLGDRPM